MSPPLETFLRLGAAERRCFLQALFLMPVVHVAVRLIGLKGVQRRLAGRVKRSSHGAAAARDAAARTAWLVGAARRRVRLLGVNCLSEALVLDWLLRRQGLASELRLGVRQSECGLEAHAWVEHAGQALGRREPGDAFRVLERAVE